MKKRFLSLFMALIMMFSFSMTVFAIGEGDIDTGGGSAGDTDNSVLPDRILKFDLRR